MSKATDDLAAAVAANTTVTQSVLTLVGTLAQQIKDANASGDADAVEALANQLLANNQQLADAVTANTSAPQGA